MMKINKKQSKSYLQLLSAMTTKDFKVRYKRALFGFLWVILNPLLQMMIIASVLIFIIKVTIENYPLFLFVGLLTWNFFSLSFLKATASIVHERTLIQKAKFARSVIPVSIILSNFLHLLASIFLLLIWVLLFGELHLVRLALVPLVLLWLLLLTVGASLITSSYNVRFRDVSFFLEAGLKLLFYVTPILYPLSIIPKKLQIIFFLNPLTSIIQTLQYIFANQHLPDNNLLLSNILLSALLIILGIVIFRKKSPNFDDWI